MSAIERVEFPTSMTELERRWAAVRKEMEARNIDALITQNSSDWLGGYVKWFTDVPAHNDYPRNVIFYRDDLMTVVEMGNKDRRDNLGGKDPLNPGVGEWVFSPSFFSVGYTHDYDGALVAQELKRRGCKTVGWVGKGRLQYDLVRVVEEQAGNVTVRRRHRLGRPHQGDQERGGDRADPPRRRHAGRAVGGDPAQDQARHARQRADRARAIRGRAARQPAGPVPLLVGAARRAGGAARAALPGPRHAAGRLHDAADREQRSRRPLRGAGAHLRASARPSRNCATPSRSWSTRRSTR